MPRWTTITVLACSFAAITSHDVCAQAQPEDQQFAAFVASCDKRLAADKRFFERITLLKTKKMPFIFYVQRPLRDEAAYQRKVVNSYLPFLVKLVEIFEREYATPLELARRQSTPGFAIVVLSSRGSYNNYAQAIQYADLHHARAHYDPELQLAVTYVDAFAPGNPRPEERHAVLHEIVHALQHAYSTTGEMPKPVWFNEGLAEYRSASTHLANSLDRPLLDQYHLAALAACLGNGTA